MHMGATCVMKTSFTKHRPHPLPHHTYTLSFFAHSDALYYDERVGHSTETDSCDVIRPVPRHLADDIEPFGIGQFYKKYTEAYGIPVICECHVFFRLVLAMLLDEVVLNVFKCLVTMSTVTQRKRKFVT